ncbi:MAG: hypothetical protein R3E31_10790 [Chloroflexota bacterium]|nr:hypothetical protein [Anaerolineales bacterium]MCB8967396.1 hypothetical protein [Ardenticatenaceae bacterium]
MRLEKKRDAELAKRKGQANKTIIQLIWLGISFFVAYFIANLVILAPGNGLVTYRQIYSALQIPSSKVPEWVLLGGVMLIIVFIMQFIFFIGFFFTSHEGRRRTGTPSLYSRNEDPLDNKYE